MVVRMRTLILAALAVVMALGLVAPPGVMAAVLSPAGLAAPDQQFAIPVVVVNTSFLHLRSGPGGFYSVLGILSGGTQLPVVGRNRDDSWWQVQTAAGIGWVSGEFVIPRGDFTPVPIVADPGVVEQAMGVVSGTPVNVYSQPSTASGILGLALAGSQLPVSGRTADNQWWQVQTNVGAGYVLQNQVVLRGSAANVPVVATTTIAPQPAPLVPVTTVVQQGGGSVVPTTANTVAVYSQPSVNSAVLASVPGGSTLTIIGRSSDNTYLQVTGSFGTGWVVSSTVAISGDLNAVPVTAGLATSAPVAAVVAGQGGGSVAGGGQAAYPDGPAAGETSAIISVERAEVKQIADTGSQTIEYLDRNERVFVQSYNDARNYARVRFRAIRYGWVLVNDLAIVNFADPRLQVGFVGEGLLGVRVAPDLDSTTIFLLPNGEVMTVIGNAGAGWLQIEHALGTGWVEASAVITVSPGSGSSTGSGGGSTPLVFTPSTVVASAPAVTVPQVVTVQQTVAQVELPRVIVNTGNLNIRSGPGGTYTAVATVAGGTELFAIAVTPDVEWYQVQGYFGQGWVDKDYVIFRGNPEILPVIGYDEITGSAVSYPVAVVSSPVNVYLSPSVSSGLLGTASAGLQLPVVGRTVDFGWLQVQTSAGFGWVLASTVTFRGDANIIPVLR